MKRKLISITLLIILFISFVYFYLFYSNSIETKFKDQLSNRYGTIAKFECINDSDDKYQYCTFSTSYGNFKMRCYKDNNDNLHFEDNFFIFYIKSFIYFTIDSSIDSAKYYTDLSKQHKLNSDFYYTIKTDNCYLSNDVDPTIISNHLYFDHSKLDLSDLEIDIYVNPVFQSTDEFYDICNKIKVELINLNLDCKTNFFYLNKDFNNNVENLENYSLSYSK